MAGRLATLLKAGQSERSSIIKLFLDKGEQSLNKNEAKELYNIATSKLLAKDLTVFQSYLTYHSRRGYVTEVTEGLTVLAPRHKFTVTPRWQAFLIEAYTQRGEFVTAQNILRKMSITDPDLFTEEGNGTKVYEQLYIDLMLALANSGRMAPAFSLFDRMKQRGFTPSAEVYAVVIGLLIQIQDHYLASEMISEMRKERVIPLPETLTKLITFKASLLRTQECFELFLECKQHGPTPDTAMYSALISGLYHARRYEEAIRVFGEMHESMHAPREVYNYVIDACGKLKRRFKTKKIWSRMADTVGTENLNEEDYANYMAAMASLGDIDEALRVLDAMQHARLPRTHHSAHAMMSIIASMRNMEMALQHFESMRKSGHLTQSTRPWNDMITLLIVRRDVSAARALFEEMRASSQPFPDTDTFNLIMRNEEDTEEVVKLFNEMKERRVYPDSNTYHTVVHSVAKTGNMGEVNRLVTEMRGAGFVITKNLNAISRNTPIT